MRSTDELTLRPAVPGDASAVARIHVESRRAARMPPSVHSDESVLRWLSAKIAEGDETWVAEMAGEPVGYARLAGDWLDDLYVLPDRAGQGVGTALLDLVKAMRPDGFRLWVFEMNQPARRFYARAGLLEIERTSGAANEEGVPDLMAAWPGREPVAFLRRLIDEVDDELAVSLERRVRLTAAVQAQKRSIGTPARDLEREQEIARRMALSAPTLGAERLAAVMGAVIEQSLDAVVEARRPETDA